MIKRIKSSLSAKIFLITLALLVFCCAVTYGVIAWLVPKTYSNDLDAALDERVQTFLTALAQTSQGDSGILFDQFIQNNDAMLELYDASNRAVALPSQFQRAELAVESSAEAEAAYVGYAYEGYNGVTHRYPLTFSDSEKAYTLAVTGSGQPVNQLVRTLGAILPWLGAVILIISLVSAMLYARFVTRPVIQISGVSQKMSTLNFDWHCPETRTDELGTLARSLNELARRLSAALTQLTAANASLQNDIERERKLEKARMDFFSAVSHELKTPLTIIKGQLEGMLLGVGRYKDRDATLARCLAVTNSMEGLVQEILTISRLESSGLVLKKESFDLTGLVQQLHTDFEDLIVQHALQWQQPTMDCAVVSADRSLLKKALGNLIGNAVQYSPAGNRIVIDLHSTDVDALLTIENTGVHIPQDDLPKLFDPFYRLESSRNRETGGSGLGLYIVKMILDAHGTQYRIENTDAGVRVWIRFAK